MEPHIEISELIRLRDGAQPPARAEEFQAHLAGCAQCRDELEQLEMNDALAADLRALREANLTPIPEEIDRRVWAGLAESLKTGSGRARMNPSRAGRKRQHPKAPRIPNYTLHRRIGQGAFGEVWEAQDRTGLACALKVIQHAVKDYEFEGIKKARENPHPNLVAIPHVGFHRRRLYYVMEFVPELLAVRLAAGQPLSVEAALEHIRSLLEAISFLYSTGLAHRDIKPENIGFAADGTLKLLDLGLVTGADRTDATRVGTELYMPRVPGPTPAHDDLYAAGKVLYFMLTGEKPPAELPSLTVAERGAGDLACRLHKAARNATAPEPAGRFSSAGEFLAAIISDSPRKKTPGAACNPSNGKSETRTQIHIMNSTHQLLTQASTVFGSIGQSQRLQLIRLETEKLGRPRYKIVIVGQFKSGKSCLINQVFLKEKVLFSELMEATAVPTEIEHRAQKLLEVHPRRVQTETLAVGEGTEANSLQYQVGLEAGTPVLTPNPTPDDIKRATTAGDAAGRARLARETALVRLGWPAPALGDYTIVDTPGINSTNEAVAETTYRVIPEADVAVFVTPARQLDQTDLAFLRGRVFGEGLSRCLVAVNHNSRTANLNEAQLQDIVRHVGAQLQTIGRPNIPVELVNLGGQPQHEASLADFGDKLQQFLAANVLPGRVERARNILRRELHSARLECEVQLAALQKSPAEKQSVLKKLQAESRELERRYNQLLDALIVDLKSIYDDHLKGLMLGIDRIREGYLGQLKACDGLTDMQKLMERAPSLLKAPSEDLFFNAALDTRQRVQQLETKYNASFRDATAPWGQAITAELGIGNDMVTKALKNTPYPVLFLLDVGLSDWLMPGGVIWGTIWRCVFSKLPVIRDLLPSKLVKSALVSWVEREVTKQFELTKTSVREEAATVFHKVENSVRDAWGEHLNAQTGSVTGTVEATLDAPEDLARDAALRSGIKHLDELICQLG